MTDKEQAVLIQIIKLCQDLLAERPEQAKVDTSVVGDVRALWNWALKNGWTNPQLYDLVGALFRGKKPQDLDRSEFETLAKEVKK